MINRQKKDAATTHATSSSKIISVSAMALLIGLGAAMAQGGSARQTEHDIEKQKDAELLTPIRPLPRKIGETSWPEAKPEAQREANERKAAAPRETTGQSVSTDTNKSNPSANTAANNQTNSAPQAAQNNNAANSQSPSPQPPATAQNDTKPAQQQPNNPNQAAQQPQQPNTAQSAQSAPAPNNPAPNPQAAQQNNAQQAQNQNSPQPDHASIRLGTDASGKVAINEDQEQQLARALRKARPVEVNVGVQIGGRSPEGVRLAAVSRDIVDVLPQFRGYSYFATSEQVYIVDPGANRVVAMIPVKLTATVKREKPQRSTVGSAHAAQPEPATAPTPAPASAQTATVTAPAEPRSKRTTRRGNDLAGIEAAIEREVQRKGLDAQGSTVVVEEGPTVQRVPTRHWRPWFAGDVQ